MLRIQGLILCVALAATTGCVNPVRHVDENFGDSQRTLTAQQVANPEASDELRTVDGMAGTSADDVTVNYHERRAADVQDGRVRESTLDRLLGGS